MRGSHDRLARDVEAASEGGYTFGAKVVRGAYVTAEAERAVETGRENPLFTSKCETDRAYDDALTALLEHLHRGRPVAMVVATHNTDSVKHVAAKMAELGIARNHQGVHFGQIMGMCDHLSLSLGAAGYNASKLVLYGDFEEVFPWLLRRLDENRDQFGAAQQSRTLLVKECQRRLLDRLWV